VNDTQGKIEMATEKDYKPQYICWYEGEFWEDRSVVRMTPTQRHFYRALLQAAMFCSTRPHLPNDDDALWELADADDLKMWTENKAVILKKFSAIEVEGVPLLSHKRLESDWQKHLTASGKRSDAGKASAKARSRQTQPSDDSAELLTFRSTHVDGCSTPVDECSTNKTKTERKLKTKPKEEKKPGGETKTEDETESEEEYSDSGLSEFRTLQTSLSDSLDLVSQELGFGSKLQIEDVSSLANLWADACMAVGKEVSMDDYDDESFEEILTRGVLFADIEMTLRWLPSSSYWNQTGGIGDLKGPSAFCNAYAAIHKAFLNYLGTC
jgi:uncharacterized protein YdaU (DUF1376 family)